MLTQTPGQNLLIKSITPASGTALEVGTINVLVGPNNVGKSESLRDLARLAGNHEPTDMDRAVGEEPRTRVIQDLAFIPKLSLDRLLWGMATQDDASGKVVVGIGPDLKTPCRRNVAADLKHVLHRPILTARSVWTTSLGELMPLRVAHLSADRRTELVEPAPAANPLRPPESLLQAFQLAPEAAEMFDEAMARLCDGRHACLDATERVSLCLRLATAIPPLTGHPVPDAHRYQSLPRLDQQGDGWKSCAAVVLTFLVCPGRVILLDQPEAFLQPEQARRLGTWIGEHAAKLGTQVFIATRDPSLLEGLFMGGGDVTILRLSRRDDSTRFQVVPPDVGKALAVFPLFAAQHALGALFHDGVVLVPEESDRIIYQTVAQRLLRVHAVQFLHAHGGRNLAFAARILRRASLPTCVVSELDLFQSEQGFVELVKAMGNSDPQAPWLSTRDRLASHVEGSFDERELSSSANEVESFLDQLKKGETSVTDLEPARRAPRTARSKWDRLRREKLAILPLELRVWVEELLDEMKRIGVFVSPKGRLQGWMNGAAADDKELWFNRAIQALDRGECPADLRAFVAEIAAFVQASSGGSRAAGAGQGT